MPLSNRGGAEETENAPPASPILESILENARNRRSLGDRLAAADRRIGTDRLGDVVRHGPVLEALLDGPLDRREIEDRLDVSRATSHRLTRWLRENELIEKVDGRFTLTGSGEVIAEEVLRFEANVATAERLAPLLSAVCPDHREFVLEPFVEATVTVAERDDPYRPVARFASLLEETATFRGFNTTHMLPTVTVAQHAARFEHVDAELVDRPAVADRLREAAADGSGSSLDADQLTVRTREPLPYGLAIFDDRVGIGGYDERTGSLLVFVDTESPIAREWAERVYEAVRADSQPLEPDPE